MRLNTLKSIASLKLARGHYDLIKLSQRGFDKDWLFINNTQEIEYNSETYSPLNFGIVLAPKKDLSGAKLVLGNVNRLIEGQLQGALNYPNENIICEHTQITIEVVDSSLVVGEVSSTQTFELIQPRVTKESISASLNVKKSLLYNLGKGTFNSNDYPNIHI